MIASDITPEHASALFAMIREFKGLHPTDLASLASCCHWHHYNAGEHIIGYQDNTTHTYFIVQGEIRVTYFSSSGQEVILCDLATGEIFGELTAIDGLTRSALVVAKTDVIAASMSALDFVGLLQSHPQVSLAILRRLAGRAPPDGAHLRIQHAARASPYSYRIIAPGEQANGSSQHRSNFACTYSR